MAVDEFSEASKASESLMQILRSNLMSLGCDLDAVCSTDHYYPVLLCLIFSFNTSFSFFSKLIPQVYKIQ